MTLNMLSTLSELDDILSLDAPIAFNFSLSQKSQQQNTDEIDIFQSCVSNKEPIIVEEDEEKTELQQPNTQLNKFLRFTQGIQTINVCTGKISSSASLCSSGEDTSSPEVNLNIPVTIRSLYYKIRENFSDHSFVHAIAAQLCQDIIPMDNMNLLKTALLLSLTSIMDESNVPPIPIMAIGNDASTASVLMKQISHLANRFLPLSDYNHVNGVIVKDEFIFAGPTLLAKNGVLLIGDWSGLKPAVSNTLIKNIESGKVLLDGAPVCYPLECAVWAHWMIGKTTKKDVKLMKTILNVFGVPIFFDDDNSESMIDFILEEAIEGGIEMPDDELNISQDDMHQYINNIRNMPTELTKEAEQLLNNYFIACRMENPLSLTQQSFVILKMMAESFAKLCFRNIVLRNDVIAAIEVSQSFIQSVCGPGRYPSPKRPPIKNIDDIDEFIKEFSVWVYKYIEMSLN